MFVRIFGVAGAVVLVGIAVLIVAQYMDEPQISEKTKESVTTSIAADNAPSSPTLFAKNVPDGWSTHYNEELGVAFAYPFEWNLEEMRHEHNGSFGAVLVEGDGYRISVSSPERGFEQAGTEYRTVEYEVSGNEARAWYTDSGDGFRLVVSVQGCEIPPPTFFIEHENTTTLDVIDQLLDTVVCS